MKLITFITPGKNATPGIWLNEDYVLDIQAAARSMLGAENSSLLNKFSSLLSIIQGGKETYDLLKEINEKAQSDALAPALVASTEVKLLAPIPQPAKNVFCVGRNYVEHVKEGYATRGEAVELPEHPTFFSKAPSSVIGPDAPILMHNSVTQELDYEVELGVILGQQIRNAPKDEAMNSVFGYTIINDVSARDLQRRHGQWFKGKSLDGTCPIGPWIVTADEIEDPANLQIELSVNGESRQSASTSQLIFDLPTIISTLSAGMTLHAGDIIATGTPSGCGFALTPPKFLQAGDVVTCTIQSIGTLTNTVAAS